VRSFPDPTKGRHQISINGGVCPRWRHDGRELFYLDASRKLVAVSVIADQTFKVERSRELFAAPGVPSTSCGYDATPDGQRFLFNVAEIPQFPRSPITIVSNWLAELSGPVSRSHR
jgi:hypothetical protein